MKPNVEQAHGLNRRSEFGLGVMKPDAIIVDLTPRFEISPWLYMQFMEPLGVTHGSVEACWDYDRDDWREDFIEAVRGRSLFLHVVNIRYDRTVEASFPGNKSGRVFEIAPGNLRAYASEDQPDVFRPRETELAQASWRFPAGSVSAVELELIDTPNI